MQAFCISGILQNIKKTVLSNIFSQDSFNWTQSWKYFCENNRKSKTNKLQKSCECKFNWKIRAVHLFSKGFSHNIPKKFNKNFNTHFYFSANEFSYFRCFICCCWFNFFVYFLVFVAFSNFLQFSFDLYWNIVVYIYRSLCFGFFASKIIYYSQTARLFYF